MNMKALLSAIVMTSTITTALASTPPKNCTTTTGTFKNGYEYGYESACIYGPSSHWVTLGQQDRNGKYRKCAVQFDDPQAQRSGSANGASSYPSGNITGDSDVARVCHQMGFRHVIDYEVAPETQEIHSSSSMTPDDIRTWMSENSESFVRVGMFGISKTRNDIGTLKTKVLSSTNVFQIEYKQALKSVTCYGFMDIASDDAQSRIDELHYYDWGCRKY